MSNSFWIDINVSFPRTSRKHLRDVGSDLRLLAGAYEDPLLIACSLLLVEEDLSGRSDLMQRIQPFVPRYHRHDQSNPFEGPSTRIEEPRRFLFALIAYLGFASNLMSQSSFIP